MEEISIEDKQKFLKEHYPFKNVPKITDIKNCMHCGENFIVRDYKVFKEDSGFLSICCPNVLECGGTVIDWTDWTD